MKKIGESLVALFALLTTTTALADTTQPEIGIVNRTNCGTFWRYDYNYETVDTDGESPIVLSAAIFMSSNIHDKKVTAKGCAITNHYTITSNTHRATNVSGIFTLEGALANSTHYFIIESDGYGFGIDVERNQKYLQGRATARIDIDAFLAGRKLLEEEGFDYEDVVLNLGYSQGGHSGMWVNRLVAEGYRSDELPKIDYCIIGGGSYDMYSHYKKLAEENMTQYPVALPLIISGMIDAGGDKVQNEDIFQDDFIQYLPELFDTKKHDTDYINNFIYGKYGNASDKSLPIEKIVKPVFFDEDNATMAEIVYHLKQNSLVYESWMPEKTDSITFIHSKADEVVPVLNMESMERHLLDNDYNKFNIKYYESTLHTPTGTGYVIDVISALANYVPTGMEKVFSILPKESTHDIYCIDGRLIRKNTTLNDALRTLPKGIYVINGRKFVIE